MFKRAFWATVGYGAGLGTSYWAYRKARAAAQRYVPTEVASRVGDYTSGLGRDVRAAVSEGREAMTAREEELRVSLRVSGTREGIGRRRALR